jgi:RNA polymerase sigma-70 factor (ECF subfamily)
MARLTLTPRDACVGATARPTLAEIYRDHFDFVYRVARRLGGARLDPEDIAQEVFLVVARRFDSFDDRTAQITTWLYGIALNVVRAMWRRRQREWQHRADESEAADLAAATRDVVEVKQAWRLVSDVLERMAPKKREVFVLAELEGLPCAEIGVIVGAKEETVWSRLHYARQEFSEILARRIKRR